MRHNFHFEILDSKRAEVFRLLGKLFGKGYYLAGGTALALQIGHRKSYDFDVFSDNPISFRVKRSFLKGLSGYSVQTLVDTADELTVVLDKNIKITILNYFWPPIFPLIKDSNALPLLSTKDIALTKAYALGRRGNYRDYFDLYVIIKDGHAGLYDVIKWSRKKYGEVFSVRMFLEQLSYFGDLDKNEKLMFLKEKKVSREKMKKFFIGEIKKLKTGR